MFKQFSFLAIKWSFRRSLLFALCVMTACSSQEAPKESHVTSILQINGRNGLPLYRIRAPLAWIRKNPLPEELLDDSTKALCEYLIQDTGELIRLTIHNFPSEDISERISPNAQVARWKAQFEQFDSDLSSVISQSFSGYQGLLLIGVGEMKSVRSMMLAWSLQLPREHYRVLCKDGRSDVTIKATGPIALMEKYREEIIKMARSFELINEIP